MVGFGSSLRLARRPGWEDAYLDYEALKLLLTQIEAIYEEEAHLQREGSRDLLQLEALMFLETTTNRTENAGNEKTKDFRDELFIESDSDKAFESLIKYDYYSAEEEASDLEQQQQQQQQIEREQANQFYNSNNYNNPNTLQASPSDNTNGSNGNSKNTSMDRNSLLPQTIYSGGEHDPHNQHHHHGSLSYNSTDFGGMYMEERGKNYSDYDDDDDDDSQDAPACVPTAWRSQKPKKPKPKSNPRHHAKHAQFLAGGSRNTQFLSPSADTDYFVTKSSNAFILGDSDDEDKDDKEKNEEEGLTSFAAFSSQTPTASNLSQQQQSRNDSILQKPFLKNTAGSNETTSLLPTSVNGSSLFSFAPNVGPVTPPQKKDLFHYPTTTSSFASAGNSHPYGRSTNTRPSNLNTSLTANTAISKEKQKALQKLEQERKQERRKRRLKRKRRAQQRKALEKKVPRHLRNAHTKAREITERFLGLLRAECEKVMLFAQSRLGELADTAGSLRYPTMDDHHGHQYQIHRQPSASSPPFGGSMVGPTESPPSSPNTGSHGNKGSGAYDYPLSDGGLHPSASSSSDDGTATGSGACLFYWSDSSDDSFASRESGSPNALRSLSAYRDMQQQPNRHRRRRSGKEKNRRGHRHRVSSATSLQGRKHDGFDSAKRHLDHFEKLRRNRPIFQRSGNIMGEDLLLLSAVDEADGYTAVGVELMHVLRFICVNLIAVRKICRKHDNLLMNRMLGGYYHHLKMLAASEGSPRWNKSSMLPPASKQSATPSRPTVQEDEHVQNAQTLGGLLAREAGDIFETHHPAVIGQQNNYKLVGLYDVNLQQLANSRTVQVISSCLVLALSEYEVSRSRANALATLNSTGSGLPAPRPGSGRDAVLRHRKQQLASSSASMGSTNNNNGAARMGRLDETNESDEFDSDEDDGALSTASRISLTRLRFTVTSIIALREAARKKKDMYSTYLSRSMLAFTGRGVVGEGLDGCSRDTLDFLVSYDPDSALLMDPASLNAGLKQGMWSKRSISTVMISSLAVATFPVEVHYPLTERSLLQQEKMVTNSVNILPKVKFLEVPELFKNRRAKSSKGAIAILENDCFRSILRINRASHLLYTMNYFIVHPTTISFVKAIGSPPAHSALIIGAPSLAALASALLHCYVLSGDSKAPLSNLPSLRWLFLLAAFLGVIGNGVHVCGVWKDAISISILGRFMMGFSCSEILNRNIVASLLPANRLVVETAILVQMQVLGLLLGLSIGVLAEFLPFHIQGWGIKSLASTSWLMAALWFCHFVFTCIFFRVEDGEAKERLEANNSAEVEQMLARYKPSISQSQLMTNESDSSGEKDNTESADRTSLQLTFGAAEVVLHDGSGPTPDDVVQLEDTNPKPKEKKKTRGGKGRKRRMRTLKSYPSRLRLLLSYSVAVPVCLFTILYIKFAQEVLFTSCPIILNRYFRWGGGRAGIFLSLLTLTILPINYTCGHIARKYEERTVIKRSLLILKIGLFIMINYSSFVKLAFQLSELFNETVERQRDSRYDWLLGIVQYFVGFSVTFLGLISLDSASLSLLSKVSPPRIRSSSVSLQLGTIVSFVTLIARVIADFQILMIGLSHRLINTDLVNSLVLPLLVAAFVIAHFARKHYFFLM